MLGARARLLSGGPVGAARAEWSQQQEAPEDARQWEDDWDDDDVADDFAKQLRTELDKVSTN